MSRTRRDKFEEQLRALQTDINHLSYKMAIPATHSTNTISASALPSSPPKKFNSKTGEQPNYTDTTTFQ